MMVRARGRVLASVRIRIRHLDDERVRAGGEVQRQGM